jgi:hypothetical protein
MDKFNYRLVFSNVPVFCPGIRLVREAISPASKQ